MLQLCHRGPYNSLKLYPHAKHICYKNNSLMDWSCFQHIIHKVAKLRDGGGINTYNLVKISH